MKRKEKKIVYYVDPLKDDFAGTKIKRRPLPKNYRYYSRNPFWIAGSFLLYYVVALPLIFLFLKLFRRVKVIGKKNLRRVRREGYFVYGNHTQIIDALTAQVFASRGKRTYIVADQDATSIPGIRWLLKMLGVLPVPLNPNEAANFKEAVEYHIKKKHVVSLFPEAHIWPYSTHIRPFEDASFVYPSETGAPIIAMVMTYRKRKRLKNHPPLPVLHLSRPFYPDMNLSLPDRKKKLRNQIYEHFLDIVSEDDNVEWIAYKKKEQEESLGSL